MKKILYTLVAGALLVSCNEDFDNWADPQGFEAEEAVNVAIDVTSPATTQIINLAEATADTIQLINTTFTMPSGYELDHYVVTMSDAEASKTVEIDVANDGSVATADLQSAVESLYGKRPTTRTIAADVVAYIWTSASHTTMVKKTASTLSIQVSPAAPFIASAYYLVGDMVGWDEATALAHPFTHSTADVYEDPYFSIVFTTTADGQYWKIIPQTNVDAGNIWADGVVGTAIDGDTSSDGALVNADAKAGKIEKAGTYRMTLNMMDYTYTIESVASTYFVTGNPNGWTSDAISAFYPVDGNVQEYTSNWTGAWDLKAWAADNVGNWDAAIGTAVDGDGSASGSLITSGAQSFQAPEAGYWTLTVDFSALTYTWTKLDNQSPVEYTNISLSGDFNGWGDTELAVQNAGNPHNWYARGMNITAGGIKFKANLGWDVNWGTDVNIDEKNYGQGTQNGANITIAEGTYDVYFNDITGRFIFVKQ